jgi:glycosyltransferase involved in cell wall biosynthesis
MPAVALVPWGLTIEDFLEPNGLTLESFCQDFRGSWMFGYVDALAAVGVRTILVCVSGSVTEPRRLVHRPTGTPVAVLPAPRLYRLLRRRMRNPYGRTAAEAFGQIRAAFAWPVLAPLKELAPYGATPLRALLRECDREGVSAILLQEYEFPRFDVCSVAGRLRGLRVFGVFQGGDYQRWRLERLTRRAAIRLCEGLIIGSEVELERVRQLYAPPPRKLARIANPVDTDVWRPGDRSRARSSLGLSQDVRIAVWHGRVQLPKKGLDVLLEAWRLVCHERDATRLRLLLVGDGADAGAVAAAIADGGHENVLFERRLVHDAAELRTYLAGGDVYVFPSRHEGFPVAPIEAMSCGLPVVATDAGGMRAIVGEGDAAAGLVVPSEDADSLARALGVLLDDDERRAAFAQNARRRAVDSFSLAAVGRRLRSFVVDSAGVPPK